ncbi:N-acetylmuramic acid 6-phosphate etherase [Vibrio ponticus]|nr:N-acetylmuramic acid 6-phosphate etherase [Vibrio ponticus]
MLTTASMIRIGKSYQNLMVDVKATNKKLIARAVRIVMQATECDKQTASEVLVQTEYEVKLAILMILTNMDLPTAKAQLAAKEGFLRRAVEDHQAK